MKKIELSQAASYTRAGWVASVAQLFTWGLVTRRRLFISGLIFVIILAAVALVGIAQMGYQTDTLHTWIVETRIQVWKLGVDQIISHPIVGIGYGNNVFQPVLVDSPMGDKPMHLHNTPLMVGVGIGIHGLVFFVGIYSFGAGILCNKQSTKLDRVRNPQALFGDSLSGFFLSKLI